MTGRFFYENYRTGNGKLPNVKSYLSTVNYLSKRVLSLKESETLQMAKINRRLRDEGKDVIDLTLGEPDFETPEFIREAGKKAIDDGYTKYPPVSGFADLREAISKKFLRENNLHFNADQIVVSNGAKQSLNNLFFSVLDKGDEVILPAPYWVSYPAMVTIAGGSVKTIASAVESNFKITPSQLEAAITPKTKAFCFSSPCNPTGTVYSRDELKFFAEIFARHPHIFVISDEIYEHINFTGRHESIAQFKELNNRVAVVNGCSKAFAMTGWRIGYVGAPLEIAQACDKIQGQFTSGANSIAQRAALASLTGDLKETIKMVAAYKKRKELVAGLMKDIPGIKLNHPDGAFYYFPDVQFYFGKKNGDSLISNSTDFSAYLLHKAHVSTVPGKAFGNDDCIRISYATSEEKISEAIRRIEEALKDLK